jgi:hypothetical protein
MTAKAETIEDIMRYFISHVGRKNSKMASRRLLFGCGRPPSLGCLHSRNRRSPTKNQAAEGAELARLRARDRNEMAECRHNNRTGTGRTREALGAHIQDMEIASQADMRLDWN